MTVLATTPPRKPVAPAAGFRDPSSPRRARQLRERKTAARARAPRAAEETAARATAALESDVTLALTGMDLDLGEGDSGDENEDVEGDIAVFEANLGRFAREPTPEVQVPSREEAVDVEEEVGEAVVAEEETRTSPTPSSPSTSTSTSPKSTPTSPLTVASTSPKPTPSPPKPAPRESPRLDSPVASPPPKSPAVPALDLSAAQTGAAGRAWATARPATRGLSFLPPDHARLVAELIAQEEATGTKLTRSP